MTQTVYPILATIAKKARINPEIYSKWHQESLANPDDFWRKQGTRIHWFKAFTKVKNTSFKKPIKIKWYEDGITNVCYNCIDRHLSTKGNKIAFIWEGNNPYDTKKVTYNQLYENVCRLANVLKKNGLQKGDRVTIYLPMILEAVYSMLACSRIGIVHSVVFAGFSAEALATRLIDCQSNFIITADESVRGNQCIPLKEKVNRAIEIAHSHKLTVKNVLVVQRTGARISWTENRDLWYHNEICCVSSNCPAEKMNAEDPLFILYTSGSTGAPKGILHTTAGYLVYASMTYEYVFDLQPDDIYWCTGDIGWITGHSYVVYAPLAMGTTSVIYEGTYNVPTVSRFWNIIDKHKITLFYTAPTVIRTFMGLEPSHLDGVSLKSLRLLASVGEPINPQAWQWYYQTIGKKRCPVIDTWWQTETGGIMITPLPGATPLKPGSATNPFFGINPVLLDANGKTISGPGEGSLCLSDSWPGQMRGLYNDDKRFFETYFSTYPNYYFSGDGAQRDDDGYYWITGRIDDVLNVSGHRLGTAEIESALVSAPTVAEAAVVGIPDTIKGQALYCFVTLKQGVPASIDLKKKLIEHVRNTIGPIATPDRIQFAQNLPKTRSGKIMRRVLKKIVEHKTNDIGDISTLAETDIIDDLIRGFVTT